MAHVDRYHRSIDYLRVSVTDRCNFRCVYCMPPQGLLWRSHERILHYEEIETVVRAAARLGITKVRLTGGEPLVRVGIVDLVQALARIPGIDELSMTTNGSLLSLYASALAKAGLQRVNVSLDTLCPKRFRRITRLGKLEDVLDGIEAARQAGLEPVKINTVVIGGINDDEVVALAQKVVKEDWTVRFIELMSVGHGVLKAGKEGDRLVTGKEIRERVEDALGELEPVKGGRGGGPARTYRLPGARGSIGLITAVSRPFCSTCNRLRLTADGQLRPCLLSDQEIDLRTPLRQGAGIDQIQALLLEGIEKKPLHHYLHGERPKRRVMSEIGG